MARTHHRPRIFSCPHFTFTSVKTSRWKHFEAVCVRFGMPRQPVWWFIAAMPQDGRGGWQLVCHKSPCVWLCPIRTRATSDGHFTPSLAPQMGTCCKAATVPSRGCFFSFFSHIWRRGPLAWLFNQTLYVKDSSAEIITQVFVRSCLNCWYLLQGISCQFTVYILKQGRSNLTRQLNIGVAEKGCDTRSLSTRCSWSPAFLID